MPKKPDRPIVSMRFPNRGSPQLKLETLPTDKDELEAAVAERVVAAINASGAEKYECAGKSPEPGDILLKSQAGDELYLQIAEAVDAHRACTNANRERYGALLWTMDPELSMLYQGVKVALRNAGEARDLPPPNSPNGRAVVRELVAELRALEPVVQSLPKNEAGQRKGKETYISIPAASLRLTVRLLRYAPADGAEPAQWLWTGTHQVRPGDSLDAFTDVVRRKSGHYAEINAPFWLVVYSLDCWCDREEEIALRGLLNQRQHRFDRVYLFYPLHAPAGELRQLYPETHESPLPPGEAPGKLLCRFLPQDAFPKWDDPRWRPVPTSDRRGE